MGRNEEENQHARKGYRTILKQEIVAGLAELKRPNSGLFLSSISAGLDLGFSVLLMGVIATHFTGLGPEFLRIAIANAYSVGFILVILGRSELFTEHTALAMLPVLDGRSSVRDLARVWGIVFAGNALGALVFAGVLQWLGHAMGTVETDALNDIARMMTHQNWWVTVMSAVLAGWLMGEVGWLIAASRDTISQILCVWIITSAIGLAHLHHVVVGTIEVAAGIPGGGATVLDLVRFWLLAGTGNVLGGVIFVAMIKYGHAVRSKEKVEDIEIDEKE